LVLSDVSCVLLGVHSSSTRRSSDLKAMEEFCAAVLEGAKVALSLSAVMTGKDCVSLEVDAAAFVATPAISVDYAVMEKVQNLALDRKSTRLNSSHVKMSYAVFCLQ